MGALKEGTRDHPLGLIDQGGTQVCVYVRFRRSRFWSAWAGEITGVKLGKGHGRRLSSRVPFKDEKKGKEELGCSARTKRGPATLIRTLSRAV